MDEHGFREQLRSRRVDAETVERSVADVRRFEEFLRRRSPAAGLDRATADDVARFVDERFPSGADCGEALLAIGRYARLVRNDEVLVAVLERIDGADVPSRLSEKLAEIAGERCRDDVFADLEIPPIVADPADKSRFMRELMERLSAAAAASVAATTLSANLHYQPREAFDEERKRYLDAPDIDSFVRDEHRRYVEYLAQLQKDGVLYFTQPITDDVLAYVRDTPTCGGGVRDGDVIRITKVPYQADRYLHETDEQRKRYFCCHCPWARESILHPESTVPALFCNCSAGFEKQYWDAVLDQPVRVDVVRSALRGDLVCEFEVHLPPAVVPAG